MKKLKDYMEVKKTQKKAEETTEVKVSSKSVELVKGLLNKENVTDKEITNLIKKLLKEEIKIAKLGDV